MRAIRFDRGNKPQVERATQPMPPRVHEPLMKRLLQGAVLFALLLAFGYWLASLVAFHQFQGIVIGDQATIAATDPGVVKDVFRGLHQPFRAGDVLMKVDNAGLRLRLEALEREIAFVESGSLANETEEIARLQAKVDVARAGANAAESERRSAEERASAAQDLLGRVERLRAEGAATQPTVDARARDARAAEAALAGAEQRLAEARNALAAASSEYERSLQLGSRQKRLDQGMLLEKKAERDDLKQRVENLNLRAASDGIVAHIVKWRGDSVQTGEPLVQVFYQGEFSVDVYVDPEQRNSAPVGTEVKIKSGGPLKVPLSGRVISVSPVTHSLPSTHREVIAQVEQFIVARVAIDLREALEAGLSPGQIVKVQIPRW